MADFFSGKDKLINFIYFSFYFVRKYDCNALKNIKFL